ncbi:MAG: PQQ-binding-like beta-propeller repeat protein [Candidatus Aenigmatarchaeota archaeon]
MKTEVKINFLKIFLLVTLISSIFLFKLPTAFTQKVDPILQFNQTSSANITGNASTLDQQQIDSYLNFNADDLTWDITENEIPIREQKTVEYFIYQDMTQMAANTEKSASFTIYLPEKNPKIRSAIVEIKNNIYNTQITAGQTVKIGNGTINTTLLTTAAGPAASGEQMPYVILADATPAFAYINQNGTYTFTLYVKLNAIRQGESAKLILTYEYDSDSPRQIKTVRFFIGQLTSTLAVGSSTAFTVPALNLPESNVVVRDSFFETYIHLQPGGTTDEGISINLDGSNSISGTPIDNAGATTTTHVFLYKNIFDTTTSHTFNFSPTAGYAIHGVGTELVLTYEYDASSPIQLKTLRYLIGQDGGLYTANHTANFQKQVSLPENNKTIKSVYNRVTFAIAYGTGAGNTAYTTYIGINSSIQGSQQPQVTYALGLRDEQVSTTTLLYNASGLYNLEDGSTVVCSVFSSAVGTSYYTGSKGCELVVTYTYDAKSSTRAKTIEYFVGQSYNSSLATSVSFPFQLQIPEQAYSIKDSYLTNFGFTGSTTTGTNTLVSYINVPDYVSQTCNFRNTGEARFDMCWDYVGDNVTVANSYTAVLSSSVTRWFSSKITTTYTYNAYYQVEVEHNTTASYSGSLQEIDVMINFSSTLDDVYGMKIYDFAGSKWDAAPCQSISANANQFYVLWCNVTENVGNYISQDGKISVRINSSADTDIATLKIEYVQFYLSYEIVNNPPTLGERIESPASGTTYSPGATYTFTITINDLQGETDISTVIFEFNGVNETVTNYVIHNSTSRNYSITKTDLAANPSGYIFKWYANDSKNAWGNVVEGTYIIKKADSVISISFSNNPVIYPTQTIATCQKNAGDYSAILTLYRNTSQVAQDSGNSISESLILGASAWNYTCLYQESENYTSSFVLNQFLYVNKGTPTLNILLNDLPNDLEITYPKQTNATAYESNVGDEDVVYNFYRNTSDSSFFISSGSFVSDVLLLGAGTYHYVYNTSGGANWTSASFTRTLTVNQNTSTINFMHLTINGTEGNKVYTYPVSTNTTAWFDAEAFVGQAPVFTLYRNFTVIGSSNPVSDIGQLAAGFYNYTFYTPGNQNYSSAIKQFNLTINKADISPYLHIAINGTEDDSVYTYENVTNATAWSTLTGQSGITYNFYRNTSTSSVFIGSGSLTSEITRLGANTYYYVYNTTGNENYTAGSITRILTITKKVPINLLEASPSWTNTYPTETTVTCSIISLNNEVVAQLYRNSSSFNPLPSNSETITLGAGYHEYVCNSSATENYTASSNSSFMIINKGNPSPYMNLYIDNQTSDKTIIYPDVAEVRGNVSSILGAYDLIFNLYRNDFLIGSGDSTQQIVDSTRLGNGTYIFVYNTSGGANWTSASFTRTLYVLKGFVPLHLTINGSENSQTFTYENVTNVTGWSEVIGEDLQFNLYRDDELKAFGSPASETTLLGVGTYTYTFNTSGGANYSSNSTSLTLTITPKQIKIYLALNGSQGNRTYTYPEVINATAWKDPTINGEGSLSLLRDGVIKGSGQIVSEIIILGNGTYNYSAIFSASNYTAENILTNRFAFVNKGIPPIFLAINGTQGNVTYTYPSASNATGWLETFNDEGEIQLWRNGVSVGKGKVVKEEIILGAGEYNYSLTFDETQNYSSASITQDRFLRINKAPSTATLILEPTSPITYGTPTIATCIETNPEDNGKLWRNGTDVTSENNTAIILPAGIWYYVCNVSETQNYTFAEDSTIYVVDRAASKIRLFLNGSEGDAVYTYEDYANITATLNVSGKIFYIEANFTGNKEVIAQGESPLTLITNDFGAGLFNITAYWDGDQNYTGDAKTYFMTVNKKPTVLYLWINGSREDRYFLNKSYVNFTVELVGYPGKILELWTNYTDGQWKKWDYGPSPLQNITQLTKTGVFNFTGNYSGNANYTASYESWILTVGTLNLEAKLESLYPKNINQGENSTAIGNCSCSGGSCSDVYMEIQADGVLIPNMTGSYLQVNGSNPFYIGTLENNWVSIAWNITGLEAGNFKIRIKCNSSETGESFSTEEILNVNDTTAPKWFNNFTFPTSPTIYSPGQTYWFNITWFDNVDISTVLIEHNFTEDGSLRNDTMNRDGYDYYFLIRDLPGGIYVFRTYANDTSNNWNKTDSWIYVINKAPTSIKLSLNGSESDRTYNVSDVANFTVSLNISGKIVYLETNISGWVLQSSITPLFNYTKLKQKGIFNITGYFLGDENYTASSQTYFATVLDVESPSYFDLGQNSSWVGVNKSILLFANWNDNYDLDYAWFSTNETGTWENKSVIKLNLTEGRTWSNFTWKNSSIPAGWIIAWRIYANDSSGNENVTEIMSFEVNASEMWRYLTNDIIFSSPAIGDVNYDATIDVVFASYDKNVYVISGRNGTKIWNFSTNGKISSSPSLASTNNDNFLNVFVGSYDFNLYALNGSDGSKIWNFSTNGKILSSPAIGDVNKDGFLDVVFGSEDGKVYALNGSDGNLLWTFSTNGKIVSSPALRNLSADGYPVVFVGSYDFNIYALNGSDGSKIWNFSAGEKIESSPAIDDLDMNGDLEVIFGSYDKNVYVLKASSGEKIWNYSTGNWITSSPVIANISNSKKIIISSHDGNVYCLNHDGSINWTFSIPTGGRVPYLPSVADLNLDGNDDIAIGATDGRIYVLNGIDGRVLWSYVIGQYIYSSPAIADLNGDGSLDLTFGSTNKYQYALDPPSWNCFGGNVRRTRIFDNSPPQLLSFDLKESGGKKILTSLWREKFSNLDYAIVQENSTGSEKIEKIKLKGMVDWINYSFSDTSYYKITVFDEYGNFEIIEGFVEIERKDLQAPFWIVENDHVKVNYSKNFELKLNVSWFDESKIDVIIEHNFTGEFKNESLNEISGNVYSYPVKNLPAGIYVWKEYARDVYNNWNSTPSFILEISKSRPLLDFHLPEKIVYPNQISFNCTIIEGDENTELILKRNGEEISKGKMIGGEEFLKAGFWNYSCIYPETQNYSHLETTKSVEVERGSPILNLLVDYEKGSCPARSNVTAYENNLGDEDVNYTLYGKELISSGSRVNYIDYLKAGNYIFVYNSTGGENWTSNQISRMFIIDDSLPPQNLIFEKIFERGRGLNIHSLWQENCSSLAYGVIEENSTGKFKEHKVELIGSLDWVNYTIPLEDLNSEDGCKWFLLVCFKNIHFDIKVFDEYKNQQKLHDSFIYIFIKPKRLTNFLVVK